MEEAREEQLGRLCLALGYQFKDLELLEAALRHSSYVHEQPGQEAASNERLEFLGDAVLELAVTQFLYDSLPQASEGELSRARSAAVNTNRLAAAARRLELGGYLLLGRGEEAQKGHQKPSILADALEAVLAAVYLDSGLKAVSALLPVILGGAADQMAAPQAKKDFKTLMQEKVQERLHITPRYRLLASEGPDHEKVFQVALEVEEQVLATGQGRSKKEAEQDAAKQALQTWGDGE